MDYIKSYYIFERFYKDRTLIGKAGDWIHGRKSYEELIEGNKSLVGRGLVFLIDVSDESCKLNPVKPGTFVISDGSIARYKAIEWVNNNPGNILVTNLNLYKNTSYGRQKLIKFNLLIRDLIEVTKGRLEIININIKYDHYEDEYEVFVELREIGWVSGDGIPDDIYNDNLENIRNGLKRKKEKYIKEYNILQSQQTTQRMRYRTINLYRVSPGYRSKYYDDDLGIMSIKIDASM